jgi:hypothetical protein
MTPPFDRPVRIASWNLGHQTRLAPMHPRFLDAIRLLQADVLILNEYVHDHELRRPMVQGLAELGYGRPVISTQIMRPPCTPGGRGRRNNQVLIASRHPLHIGDLQGPATEDNGGKTNFQHIHIDALGLELVGLRVPAYTGRELQTYWKGFVQIAHETIGRRICFIGDFNADPDRKIHSAARQLSGLRNAGWKIPRPEGEWSFKSGTRIDHVLASPGFPALAANYVVELDGLPLAGETRDAISDHAALVVTLPSGGDS